MRYELFGIGGYCENCDTSHDHPLNNIIEVIEYDEPAVAPEPVVDSGSET